MAITTDLAKVRLYCGDTDSANPLLTDAEIQVALDARGSNLYLAAADCCSFIRAEFSRRYDFETDGQRFDRSQQVAHYTQLEKDLRARATGVTSQPTTRLDGWSDDIPYDELEPSTSSGRVRAGYTDPDLPV